MFSLYMTVMTLYLIAVLIVIPGLIEWFLVPVGYLWIPYLIATGAILFTNAIIWFQFARAYRKHRREKRIKAGEEKDDINEPKAIEGESQEGEEPQEEGQEQVREGEQLRLEDAPESESGDNQELEPTEENDSAIVALEEGEQEKQLPTLSSIIVAYLPNEKEIIEKSLEHHLAVPYNGFHQVILVYNTNNNNDTAEVEERLQQMKGYYGPYKKLDVFNVVGSSSKAENVNHAIQFCEGPIVAIYDSDCLPLPEGLDRCAKHLLKNDCDVVQGRCVIRNGDTNLLTRMIAVEFEMIYGVNHAGGSDLYGFGIFGGSNAYWKREVLALIQMDKKMLTEDIDSSFRAMRLGKKIMFDRQVVATELAPETLSILRGQRLRWAQGWFQTSLRHYLPSLMSNKFGKRQKLGTTLLFLWREIYVYLPFQPILCWMIYLFKTDFAFEINWIFWLFLSITILTLVSAPCQMLATYVMSHDIVKPNKMWFLQAVILFWPYQLLLSLIALGSHSLEFFKVRNWVVTSRAPTAPVLEIPFEEVIPKEITVVVEQEPIGTPRQLVPEEEEDDDFSSDGEDEFEQMKLREGEDEEDVVVVVDQHAPRKFDVFEDEIELDSDDEAEATSSATTSKQASVRRSTKFDEEIEEDDEDPKADFLKAMLKKPIDRGQDQ